MKPSGCYNQVELRYRTEGFSLDFEAEWDHAVSALFGPSGSGKSTVLEIIAGVRGGAQGRIILDGRTILDTERGIDPPSGIRWIGWVPQDASLFPHLSAEENVRFGRRRGGPEGERRAKAAIEVLELGELLGRPSRELSVGERQRVAIARAVASGARVLLLDEPLASLDLPLRSRVFPLFLRLRDEIKLPMIYVTHDAEEALALAPHVLVIEHGRCVASGSTKDVLGSLSRRGAYELSPTENRFVVRLQETLPGEGTAVVSLTSGVLLSMSAVPLPRRDAFEVVVRSDEIVLAVSAPGLLSAQNVLMGTILSIEEEGGHALITAEVSGSNFVVRITRRALSELGIAAGRPAWLIFKASSVRAASRTDRPPC